MLVWTSGRLIAMKKMLKFELLTLRDGIKIAGFSLIFGGSLIALLMWLAGSGPPPLPI
jgi:hypothetical protein